MKKVLFIIISCCVAVSTAFAQLLNINSQLSEDKPQDEVPIVINGYEQGRFVIMKSGEPDDQGRTPVQIKLENKSDSYEFLLFDRDWPKKELRKHYIVLEKNFVGENSKAVQDIELINKNGINEIEKYVGIYIFPEIHVDEGKTYDCKIPIHLAKLKPGLFCPNRKKLYDIRYCNIRISVDNRDKIYEKFENECDSLLFAFKEAREREAFCTNSHHKQTFDEQIKDYTEAEDELRSRISQHIKDKGWPESSKRYIQYKALLDSIDTMDDAIEQYANEKHDCGQHKTLAAVNCKYCKLTLEDIWIRMSRLYFDLRNKKKQKPEVLKEAKALYNCCTNHKKQERQWKNSEYKKDIEDYYKFIKDY